MSLSYKGENIPEMYEELIRLRAQLERANEIISDNGVAFGILMKGRWEADSTESAFVRSTVQATAEYERELDHRGGGDE